MNKIKFLPVLLFTLLYVESSVVIAQKPKKQKKTVPAATYQCPMKCEGDKTYVKAGRCPECGMSLKALPVKKK